MVGWGGRGEIFNTQNLPSHTMLFYSRLIKGKERRGEGEGGGEYDGTIGLIRRERWGEGVK